MKTDKKKAIAILAEFKEMQELEKMAKARIKAIKEEALKTLDPGEYGEYIFVIEEREMPEFVSKARTDKIYKVYQK